MGELDNILTHAILFRGICSYNMHSTELHCLPYLSRHDFLRCEASCMQIGSLEEEMSRKALSTIFELAAHSVNLFIFIMGLIQHQINV